MKACFATNGFNGKVDCREYAHETKNLKSLPEKKKEEGGYNMYRPKNCKKCGGKMQAGGSPNPSAGLTYGPTYNFGFATRQPNKLDSMDYRFYMQQALQNPQAFEQQYVNPAFGVVMKQEDPKEMSKWFDIGMMNKGILTDAQRDLAQFGPNAMAPPVPIYKPRDTVKPKKQMGGTAPRQQDYPDYESWQAAMDQWNAGQQDTILPSDTMQQMQPNAFDNIQGMQSFQPTGDMTSSATWDPMSSPDTPTYASAQRNPPRSTSNNPYQALQNVGLGMKAARTVLGEISGRIERGRQNQYDYQQQTALGQMNPMQSDDFQPNPYNLYMEQGGNLKTILRNFNKYTNDAQFDFGSGDNDEGMMKKGGYEIDRMLIVRKLLPELLKLGRLGTSKYRNYQAGGPTVINDILRNPATNKYNSTRDLIGANTGNRPDEFAMNKQTLDDVSYIDDLNQAIASGQITQSMRTSLNPELVNYLNIFSTRPDLGTNPEQRVRSFYDIRSNNPQIEAIKEKLKPFNPVGLYQSSSRTLPQPAAAAAASPAFAAAFQYGGTSKYRNMRKAHGGNAAMTPFHDLSPEQYAQMLQMMQMNQGILPVNPENPMEGFHRMDDSTVMSDAEMAGYAKGGIHIKKENRGKFTEYCGGKVTDECIQKGLNSSNPTTRKRANFARNARKWN